jgi:hypothetical protein
MYGVPSKGIAHTSGQYESVMIAVLFGSITVSPVRDKLTSSFGTVGLFPYASSRPRSNDIRYYDPKQL